MLGFGEVTQSDMLLGNIPVMPEETTALFNTSRLISCSICNTALQSVWLGEKGE